MSDEFRKARLNHLIQTDYQSQVKFAFAHDLSKGRVSQMLGKEHPFGERAANNLEERLGLERGWFNSDWPTPLEVRKQGGKPIPINIEGGKADPYSYTANILRLGDLLKSLDATDKSMVGLLLESLVKEPSEAANLAAKLERLLGGETENLQSAKQSTG